jgi:predicted transcriptional regulator
MRTTVTLDEDVASKLQQTARERGVSFKAALNDAIRAGLGGNSRSARRYRMRVYDMGLRKGVDLDRALRLADELEDEEILRKLELRK